MSETLFPKFCNLVETKWLQKFENFSFSHVSKYGFVFGTENLSSSSSVTLLLPRLAQDLDHLRSRPYGCLTTGLDLSKNKAFYEVAESQIVFSEEIKGFIDLHSFQTENLGKKSKQLLGPAFLLKSCVFNIPQEE